MDDGLTTWICLDCVVGLPIGYALSRWRYDLGLVGWLNGAGMTAVD